MNYNAQVSVSDLCKSDSIKTKLQLSEPARLSAALTGMAKSSVSRTHNRRFII